MPRLMPSAPPGRWQPGGHLGAPIPELLPITILAKLMRNGQVVTDRVDVYDGDGTHDPIPGEIPWSTVVEWIDINQVR